MTAPIAPTPYLSFAGTAREALSFYGEVFGCAVEIHTFEEFGRDDGAPDAVAHGRLVNGPIALYASDATDGERPLRCEGMMLALLGATDPSTLTRWFTGLCDGGRVVAALEARPWGASDGQVVDRFGLHWLIGFEHGDVD